MCFISYLLIFQMQHLKHVISFNAEHFDQTLLKQEKNYVFAAGIILIWCCYLVYMLVATVYKVYRIVGSPHCLF